MPCHGFGRVQVMAKVIRGGRSSKYCSKPLYHSDYMQCHGNGNREILPHPLAISFHSMNTCIQPSHPGIFYSDVSSGRPELILCVLRIRLPFLLCQVFSIYIPIFNFIYVHRSFAWWWQSGPYGQLFQSCHIFENTKNSDDMQQFWLNGMPWDHYFLTCSSGQRYSSHDVLKLSWVVIVNLHIPFDLWPKDIGTQV